MNSGSEKKLSMDELMERNRPAHTVQTESMPPPQEVQKATPSIVIQCPMPEALDRLDRRMRYLERNSSGQTEYLKQLTEMRGWLPTRTQVDELTKAVTKLCWMAEQAGKKKERRFSLSRIPRPHLPDLDGPEWFCLLSALAVLGLLLSAWLIPWSSLTPLFQ